MDTQDLNNFSTSESHRLPTVTASAALEATSLLSQPIHTGLPNLDTLLNADPDFPQGGLPRGQVTEIYGPPASGKTAIAMQTACSALHEDPKAQVCWIDTAGPVPLERLKQLLSQTPTQAPPAPSSQESVHSHSDTLPSSDSSLARFHHYHVPSLSHLLTLFLHPTSIFPPPATSLIVLDNVSSIFSVSFPYSGGSSHASVGTKASAISFASNRRFAVAGDLSNAMSKLAILKNCGIIVLNQTGTQVKGLLRAALRPSVGGKEWDSGIGLRCVVYKDFTGAYGENENGETTPKIWRWVEVVKRANKIPLLEGKGTRQRVAFQIGKAGLRGVSAHNGSSDRSLDTPSKPVSNVEVALPHLSQPASIAEPRSSPPVAQPDYSATPQAAGRKRKASDIDVEIADSEDETEEPDLPPPPIALPTRRQAGSLDEEVDEYGSMAIGEDDFDFEEAAIDVDEEGAPEEPVEGDHVDHGDNEPLP